MLVSMATVDSDNEMSCLELSVCGNRSLQYKELYLICLDKILDLTGEHGLKNHVDKHWDTLNMQVISKLKASLDKN